MTRTFNCTVLPVDSAEALFGEVPKPGAGAYALVTRASRITKVPYAEMVFPIVVSDDELTFGEPFGLVDGISYRNGTNRNARGKFLEGVRRDLQGIFHDGMRQRILDNVHPFGVYEFFSLEISDSKRGRDLRCPCARVGTSSLVRRQRKYTPSPD